MTTPFCRLVGVARPLQQAAMSRVTTPELVAAVSNAGALGMVAVGRAGAADALAMLDHVDALTTEPHGAGFVIPLLDRDCFEAVAERLPIIELFFGWPDPQLVPAATVVGWQVGTAEEARAAVDAGCAYVIAQGVEAGGHVRDIEPIDELLPAVRGAVDVPVVAAGGIGTRSDADRLFELGADAIRVGTRFLAAAEANVHPRYLELLLGAADDDTTRTEEYCVGWPDAPVRVLSSAVAEARGADLDPIGHLGERPIPRFSPTPPVRETTGLIDAMALYAGARVGAVRRVVDAASIVAELVGGR